MKRKIRITEDNISWGITALLVICLSIAFYLLITQMPSLKRQIGIVIDVMMPIILGIATAYLLLPVYNFLYRCLFPLFSRRLRAYYADGAARAVSVSSSVILMLVIVLGLLILAVPQIIQSILSIANAIPANLAKLSDEMTKLLENNPALFEFADNILNTAETNLNMILQDSVIPYFTNALSSITKGIINVAGFLFDLVIGIIVCVYILINKEKFSAQATKFVYSVMKIDRANRFIADVRRVHLIFGGFISGSIIDSLIIGLITFAALTVMNMPYVVIISVIIGVTNIIPIFGPFIGAVPSILIVLMVDPVKSVYLFIFIVIVQQLDGNVIKPKTLGVSTGLPSFWVLFSILVGGGFFGLGGMLLGVPVFATIYMLVTRWVNNALKRQDLPYATDAYRDMTFMDPQSREPMKEREAEDDGEFPFRRKSQSGKKEWQAAFRKRMKKFHGEGTKSGGPPEESEEANRNKP